jgi:glucose/arabinose dehydrogenase
MKLKFTLAILLAVSAVIFFQKFAGNPSVDVETGVTGIKNTDEESVSPTSASASNADPELQKRIKLAPGYTISYFAKDVRGARSMAISKSGIVFVGTKETGNVYALVDKNHDGKAEEKITIASSLNSPNGVAILDGNLYVAEISRIIKFTDIENTFRNKPKYEVIYDKLPKDAQHGWKYIAFGPDGKLYIPIGAPCNICNINDPYGTINRINPDGSGWETVARGVRNSVGFAWNPVDSKLWFTDNGRDLMGDNIPSDELNEIDTLGQHFGYPFCHQGDITDPQYGKNRNCDEFRAPEIKLGPHVAALGMKFFDNKIYIAEHGSWNRKTPIGYRISTVDINNGKATNYKVFAEGWLSGNNAWGRPVDIIFTDDKAMLISDDKSGVIYIISKEWR